MDGPTNMGPGCGQKSGQGTPPELPRSISANERMDAEPTVSAAPTPTVDTASELVTASAASNSTDTTDAAWEPVASAPQDSSADAPRESTATSDKVFEDEASDEIVELDITHPPIAVPRLSRGMSLPAWLKLVIKYEEGYALDQFDLLTAYHHLCEPPHVPNEALVQILLRVFGGAKERDEDSKLWLLHVRWLNSSEVADVFEAGHEAGSPYRAPPPRGVSTEVQRNAAHVMDYLLTVGDGKLPSKPAVSGSGVKMAPGSSTVVAHGILADTAQNPPPPPPAADPVPQNVNDILASHAKRDIDAEFQSVKAAAPYDSVVYWLKLVIVEDPESVADPTDVVHAYSALRGDSLLKLPIDAEIMQRAIIDIFPSAQAVPIKDEEDVPFVKGLRWEKMESPINSMALPYLTLPEKYRNEAHKLLHVPDPERTKLWLKSIFVAEAGVSLSLPSMWEFYERIFWRWADTHPHLEMEVLFDIVSETFRKCKAVEVSQNYRVFVGLRWRAIWRSAKEVLARQQKQNLRRLQRAGEIAPPKSAFAQKLLQDPLLIRVRRDENNCPIPGSYVARTRRRGGDPETREKAPFGDEEPGFPGLSMKRHQLRFKRELREYEEKTATTQQEVDKQAGPQTPDPNAPPHGGITYVD